MGLPALNIVFVSAAKNTIKRSQRGVVGMIIKEATTSVKTNPVVIYKESDIPTELSPDSKEQITFALKGNVNAPSKIVVYVLGTGDVDYKKALAYFELKKVNWLCCPTIKTDKQEQAVATWVKEQREKRNKVKAVLPNQEADSEGVVNYATDSATIGEKKYTADKFKSSCDLQGIRHPNGIKPGQQRTDYLCFKRQCQCTEQDCGVCSRHRRCGLQKSVGLL